MAHLAGRLAQKLVAQVASRSSELDPQLVQLTQVERQPAIRDELIVPVSTNGQARSDVLSGLHELESAVSYTVGSSEALPRLEAAREFLERAVGPQGDRQNGWAQLLLANCYYNLFQHHTEQGDTESAGVARVQYQRALARAYASRNQVPLRSIRNEIAADYALLQRSRFDTAIGLYQELTSLDEDPKLHMALRAHWMLAGIYSGDWQAPAEVQDPERARHHLVQILAHWPDSEEAKSIRAHLRWDDQEGGTQFGFLPLSNMEVADRPSE